MRRLATDRQTRSRVVINPLTLVEMTIILSVISILTTVLVPTVMSHIAQSRILRAQQDVKTIGDSIVRLYQDTGYVPKTADCIDGAPGRQAVDMLVSEGGIPALPHNPANLTAWTAGTTDLLSNHLVNNVPGYRLKADAMSLGWNGPYVTTAPAADPWGNRYMTNVTFLEATAGVFDSDGRLKSAVLVVSAGPNGTIETAFDQPLTDVATGGDDIVHRLQ